MCSKEDAFKIQAACMVFGMYRETYPYGYTKEVFGVTDSLFRFDAM